MRWFLLIIIPMAIGAVISFTSPGDFQWLTQWSAASTNHDEPRSPGRAKQQERPLIFASGTVEGAQRDVPMRFEIAGRIESVNVTEGQLVKKGDLLAALNAETLEKQQELATAKLDLAKNERARMANAERQETIDVAKDEVVKQRVRVAKAKQRYDRGNALDQRGAGTAEDLDDRRWDYQTALADEKLARSRLKEIEAAARDDDLAIADAKIAQAEAEVKLAKTELDKAKLLAPTDGIILRVSKEPGQMAGPQDTEPILVLVNNVKMRTRAFVEELDALSVQPGQSAYVMADGDPHTKFPGTIVSCSPYMVPKKYMSNEPGERVDVKVREVIVELDQQDTLVVGLPVDVFIRVSPEADAAPETVTEDNPDIVSADSSEIE